NPLEGRDNWGSNRDVRHEMPVHHINVDQIGAAALDRGHRLSERRKVCRQNRRRNQDAHRLTSSEIGSPGAIWNPACGLWRSTTPAATPGYGFDPTTATRNPWPRRISAARSPLTPMRSGITYVAPRPPRLTSSVTRPAVLFAGGV